MDEEFEDEHKYKTKPIIVVNKIKDELENKRIMIMNRVSDNEEFLFNKIYGKVPNLQKIIDYDSDYQQLRIVKDINIIIDKITKLAQEYINLLTLYENAFKELYDFCLDNIPEPERYNEELQKIKNKLEKQEEIIKKKEDEIEIAKEEGFETLLANTDVREYLEYKAKKDKNIKLIISKIKKDKSAWEKLDEVTKQRQIVITSDIQLDETFLPTFDDITWELLKKYDYLTKLGKTIEGRKMDGLECFITVCNLPRNLAYDVIKKYKENVTNLMVSKKLQSIELTDGYFFDRVEDVKNGRIKITGYASPKNED